MNFRSTPAAISTRARASFALISMVSAVMALLLAAATSFAAGRDPKPPVLPPGSTLHGKTYGDWAAAWWAWTLQIPLEQNPLMDPIGANSNANAGQKGPVWFLPGTVDGSVQSFVTIPAGKRILFPVFNVLNEYSCPDSGVQPDPGQALDEFLAEGAEAMTDRATELFAEVDSVPIRNLWGHRVRSDMVMLTKHPSLAALDPCVTSSPRPAVVGGYWLMLTPLDKGQHTIRCGVTARFGDFDYSADATYYVTVE